MLASDAARIFHDWAFSEGLMPDGPAATSSSTPAELALVQPVTEQGRQVLRSKQVVSVVFAETRDEIIVFTKRAAPASKKLVAALPAKIDNVVISYRQGAETLIGTEPPVAFGGPPYVVRQTGTALRYTCGSSISVGNFRDAGTLGCLIRNAAGVLHGLSNNHVAGGCNFAGVGLPILAPGIVDVVANGLAPFTLGFHTLSLNMVAGSVDNVDPKTNQDAAMFRIANESLVSSFQGTFYDTPIATMDFIDGMEVEKVGRTTGHTRGRVIGQIFGAQTIQYSAALYGFTGHVSFDPAFSIVGQGDLFSDNGDSGSLITTLDGTGQRFAVGIVVGGKSDGTAPGGKSTIALPIAPILQGFGASLVSGHNI
jgi:hypothetical protein